MFTLAVAASAAEVVTAPTGPVVQGASLVLAVAPPTDPADAEGYYGEWWVEGRSREREAPVLLVASDPPMGQGRTCAPIGPDGRWEALAVQRQLALTPGRWTLRIARLRYPITGPPDDGWTEVAVTVRAPTPDEVRAMVWEDRGGSWSGDFRISRCEEGALAGDVFVPAIVGRLRGPLEPVDRTALLGGLAATPTPVATDALLALLDHRDPVVRAFAIEALTARAAPARGHFHEATILSVSLATAPFDPADLPVLRAAARRLLVEDVRTAEGARRAHVASRALGAVGEPEDLVAVNQLLDALVGVPSWTYLLEPLSEGRARLGIDVGPLATGRRPDPSVPFDVAAHDAALLSGLAHRTPSVQAFALERLPPAPSPAVRDAVVALARRASVDLEHPLWYAVSRMGPPFPADVVLDAVPRSASSIQGLDGLLRAATRLQVPRDVLAARIVATMSSRDRVTAARAAEGLFELVLAPEEQDRGPGQVAADPAAWSAWVEAHAAELADGKSWTVAELEASLPP